MRLANGSVEAAIIHFCQIMLQDMAVFGVKPANLAEAIEHLIGSRLVDSKMEEKEALALPD